MATQDFNLSKHFSTFECLSGYYQLRWKDDVIIDDPANDNYYNKEKAMDLFNVWIDVYEEEWHNYTLKFFDEDFNEINSKSIIAYDDIDAEKIAKAVFANDMMNTDHIEVYDWKGNYVNTID